MSTFLTMFRIELKRLVTPLGIVLVLALTALAMFVVYMSNANASTVNAERSITVASVLLTSALPLLCAGFLANDIGDHWLRSVLVRPVTRPTFLAARVMSMFSLFTVMVLVACVAWLPLVGTFLDKTVVWTFGSLAPLISLSLAHGLLLIMLMALLSIWLPGIMNLVALALWALASSLLGQYISAKYWDSQFLTTLAPFLFPSGFMDAQESIRSGWGNELTGILWGVAALATASALTLWSLNRRTIDAGSD